MILEGEEAVDEPSCGWEIMFASSCIKIDNNILPKWVEEYEEDERSTSDP
jgi:hypothetical protein